MKVFVSLCILFEFLCGTKAFAAPDALLSPKVTRMGLPFLTGTNYKIAVSRGRLTCSAVLDREHYDMTELATKAANREFIRRGWPTEFINGRLPLAHKYADRTEEILIYKGDEPTLRNIVGTIAVTWAEYDKDTLYDQLLPEEETLGIRLNRPLGKNGKGVIFELRTYSMNPKHNGMIFPAILEHTMKSMISKLQDLPELFDEEIVHTYGDRAGRLLYTPLGFVFNPQTPKDQPIVKYFPRSKKTVNWWALSSTLKKFEAQLLMNLRIPDEITNRDGDPWYDWIPSESTISKFNQALPAPLPGAPQAQAAPGSHIAYDDEGRVGSTILAEDTLFDNGLWAARGAHVVQYYGYLSFISKTARDFLDPDSGVFIPAGSKVSFHAGKIFAVDDVVFRDPKKF